MVSVIVPFQASARRIPRLVFSAASPQRYGLDDELCLLMEQYAACQATLGVALKVQSPGANA